jgi:hypothetical protein
MNRSSTFPEQVTIQKRDGTKLRTEAVISGYSFLILNFDASIEAGDVIVRACGDGLLRGFVIDSVDINDGIGPIPRHLIATTKLAPPLDCLEDAEFWRARADEFASLAARQDSAIAGDKEHRSWLVGLVIYAGPDDQSGRSEARGGLDNVFRTRFDEAASRSAIALGCPTGLAPVAFWLHCLWQDLIENHSKAADREVYRSASSGGIIHDLLASSEAYCLRLAQLMERKRVAVNEEVRGEQSQVAPQSELDSGTIHVGRVYFQYTYPPDVPPEAQREIESLRLMANKSLACQPIDSFNAQSEAKRLWVLELASGAAVIFGKIGAAKGWGAEQARAILNDFAKKAAFAVGMTAPAAKRFFQSTEWKNLDDVLFPLEEERLHIPSERPKDADPLRIGSRRGRPAKAGASAPVTDSARLVSLTAEVQVSTPPPAQNEFRKDGEFWRLTYSGVSVTLKDRGGMPYIANLLREPGRYIACSELKQLVDPPLASKKQKDPDDAALSATDGRRLPASEKLDQQAVVEYRNRLREIQEDLEEALNNNDPGTAENLTTEKEFIEQQLRAGLGLHARSRTFPDETNRARNSVCNAIRRTIAEIRRHHGALGGHLNAYLRLGNVVAYDGELDWTV